MSFAYMPCGRYMDQSEDRGDCARDRSSGNQWDVLEPKSGKTNKNKAFLMEDS